MMTEKEAWEFCAKNWKVIGDSGLVLFPIEMRPESLRSKDIYQALGLCHFISWLSNFEHISEDIRFSMNSRIEITRLSDDWHSAYKWPTSPEGAKLRVEFCKRMAKECEK